MHKIGDMIECPVCKMEVKKEFTNQKTCLSDECKSINYNNYQKKYRKMYRKIKVKRRKIKEVK